MRIIELDAGRCTTPRDFLAGVRSAIGAPEGHGLDVDAIVETMLLGGVNSMKPPYTVRIVGTAKVDPKIKAEIETLAEALKDARLWRHNHRHDDIEVAIEIAP